jgi:hypothetical protein
VSAHDHDYEKLYRELHPRHVPTSPYGRQIELRDLWPADQEKFKRLVDKIRAHPAKGGET